MISLRALLRVQDETVLHDFKRGVRLFFIFTKILRLKLIPERSSVNGGHRGIDQLPLKKIYFSRQGFVLHYFRNN